MIVVMDSDVQKREHVTSAARYKYLTERRGLRPGTDFSTVGCLRCFEDVGHCSCEPSLETLLRSEKRYG